MANTNTNSLLLADENETRRFVREYLLPFRKARLLQLAARNKYADDRKLGRPLYILERHILDFGGDSTKAEDRFVRELRKCEALATAGLYTDENGVPLQKGWMVAYITAYALDEDDASDAFITHVLERRKERRRQANKPNSNETVDGTEPVMKKIMSTLQTLLHKSPCRDRRLLKLDIDTKDPELLRQLHSAMHEAAVVVAMETRGGFHVVIERGRCCQNLWKFARDVNANVAPQDQWITIEDGSGPLLAIPGTNQGGFTVRLATEEWKKALGKAAALGADSAAGVLS